MQTLNNSMFTTAGERQLTDIRHRFASTLVGRTVSLLSDAATITQGVVSGIFTQSGVDKLVVGRTEYDLSQLLTVGPA